MDLELEISRVDSFADMACRTAIKLNSSAYTTTTAQNPETLKCVCVYSRACEHMCVFLTTDVHGVGFRRARATPRGTCNTYKTTRFRRERKSGARRPSRRTLLTQRRVVHPEHCEVFTAKPNGKPGADSQAAGRFKRPPNS